MIHVVKDLVEHYTPTYVKNIYQTNGNYYSSAVFYLYLKHEYRMSQLRWKRGTMIYISYNEPQRGFTVKRKISKNK